VIRIARKRASGTVGQNLSQLGQSSIMAAQALATAPSGRLLKVYLLTWGLFAVAALAYLAVLAWRPDMLFASAQRSLAAEPDPALRVATQALADLGGVRRSVSEIQNDVGQLKEGLEQHDQTEKGLEQRLTVLEERVATLPTLLTKPKASDKSSDKAQAQPRTQQAPRVIAAPEAGPAESASPAQSETPPAGIVASSLPAAGAAQSAPAIEFGAAVVKQASTPTASTLFAVQLGAGPSVNGLKARWKEITEKHGSALASLEARYVKPKTAGGPYRLLAGPLSTKADAERVCTEMSASRRECFAATFIGEPL
jgi:hypothetical protein